MITTRRAHRDLLHWPQRPRPGVVLTQVKSNVENALSTSVGGRRPAAASRVAVHSSPDFGANPAGVMSSDRFEIEPEVVYREKSGYSGCLRGCLIAGVVLLVLAGIVAFWIANNWRAWVSDLGVEAVDQMLAESDLSDQERKEVGEQVDRIAEAFRSGQLSGEQLGEAVQKIIESPLMPSLVVSAANEKYLNDSGLTDEEKAQGRIDLQRFVRGMMDEKIKEDQFEEVIAHIAEKQEDGQWQFRDKATDEQLRALLKSAREKADAAEIPAEVEEIDPSDEIRRIIDETLSGEALQPEP